jgi:hypothetical protein
VCGEAWFVQDVCGCEVKFDWGRGGFARRAIAPLVSTPPSPPPPAPMQKRNSHTKNAHHDEEVEALLVVVVVVLNCLNFACKWVAPSGRVCECVSV